MKPPHGGRAQQEQAPPELQEFQSRGWDALSPTRYRHYCGARVLHRGKRWNAISVAGVALGGYSTPSAAMSYLENHDPAFWSCGDTVMLGNYSGLWFRTGRVDDSEDDRAFVCYWSVKSEFPSSSNQCSRDRSSGELAAKGACNISRNCGSVNCEILKAREPHAITLPLVVATAAKYAGSSFVTRSSCS